MEQQNSPVETVNEEISEIKDFLNNNSQPTLSINLDAFGRKILLLSAASFFEHQVISILQEYASQAANDKKMASLLYNQGLKAKYHTLLAVV